MRIRRLDLVAFGPFTERSLDLSGGGPGGLHLVYGRNAAGKSTALRAIGDLLFGIPVKTGDDHVHPYQQLRIRAELQNGAGAPLTVQRLKRAKDALRDASDTPLDEGVLARMLGGLDRKTFERVFGLDHERLREAGQALLLGGGDVGESLFDAGAGGQSVRRVLERLEGEADKLFKPRGKLASINDLLERYKAARRRVREVESLPDAYATQVSELERDKGDREATRLELMTLREEQRRKEQLQSALKNVNRRAQLLVELRSLGPVPEVDQSFAERRERAQKALTEQRASLASVEIDLERLRKRQHEIQVPEGLLSVGEAAMQELRDGIGRTRKAWLDLPERKEALAFRRREATALAKNLGFESLELYEASAPQTQAGEGRVRKLHGQVGVAAERRRGAEKRAREAELTLEAARTRLAALPVSAKLEPLETAVALARGAAGLDGALGAVRRSRAELAIRIRGELAQLAPFAGEALALVALPVPDLETVERFAARAAELERRSVRAEEALGRTTSRLAELAQELSAEELAGSVPSEAELLRARTERDQALESALSGSAPAEGFRQAVAAADQLADRLRREASRVAAQARRLAERDALLEQSRALQTQQHELTGEQAGLASDWRALWQAAGFEPLSPAEMRAWLTRRVRAVDYLARDAAEAERVAELEQRATELNAALNAALGDEGTALPIDVRVARAEQALEAARQRGAERHALQQQIAECETRLAGARLDLEVELSAEAKARAELGEAVRALGLGPELDPDDVESRLEALAELARVRTQMLDLERRIAGMRRDEEAFERQVRALVEAHASDLAELPVDRAADALHQRFERARRDQEQLERMLPDIAEREREQSTHAALREAAERELAELLEAVGAQDLAELMRIEDKIGRARELSRDLALIERTLAESAGPRGLEALIEEAEKADSAELAARLDELERRIPELEERQGELAASVAGKELGLKRFDSDSAAQAAEEEQALGAALCRDVDRWAQLRLAAVLLRREIERYREEHQGPVLRRASELYVKLTRGAYRGLRVGREERCIVTLRADDLEVGVEGLNDAARCHLYLALRLASLEGYLEKSEALPLVLDDVLIDFDEEGSLAALGVLGELAERVQILLFTHHRHNLDLARTAVAGERLFVHEL